MLTTTEQKNKTNSLGRDLLVSLLGCFVVVMLILAGIEDASQEPCGNSAHSSHRQR